MILKPNREDIKSIVYYLGKIVIGISLTMFVPLFIGLGTREFNPALDFVISLSIGLSLGIFMVKPCRTDRELTGCSAWLWYLLLGWLRCF